MAEKNSDYSNSTVTPAQRGSFSPGPTGGTCIDTWASPETVENAHDLGNRPIYEQPVNNNASSLTPAPEADR